MCCLVVQSKTTSLYYTRNPLIFWSVYKKTPMLKVLLEWTLKGGNRRLVSFFSCSQCTNSHTSSKINKKEKRPKNRCNSNPSSFWGKMVALKRIFGTWKLICVFSLHLVQLLSLSWATWWPFWAWLWPFCCWFLCLWFLNFLAWQSFSSQLPFLLPILVSLLSLQFKCRFLGCLHPFFIYLFF